MNSGWTKKEVRLYIGIEADFNLLSVNYGIYLRGETPLTGQIWKPLF
jgi:hypothetical protein